MNSGDAFYLKPCFIKDNVERNQYCFHTNIKVLCDCLMFLFVKIHLKSYLLKPHAKCQNHRKKVTTGDRKRPQHSACKTQRQCSTSLWPKTPLIVSTTFCLRRPINPIYISHSSHYECCNEMFVHERLILVINVDINMKINLHDMCVNQWITEQPWHCIVDCGEPAQTIYPVWAKPNTGKI